MVKNVTLVDCNRSNLDTRNLHHSTLQFGVDGSIGELHYNFCVQSSYSLTHFDTM